MAEHWVNLLWTGGEDSTYRLLELVLNHQRPVQPYYLVDGRPSLRMELMRMGEIRTLIRERSAHAAGLVRPTIIVDQRDLPDDDRRYGQYRRIKSEHYLGRQYELLARLADYLGLDDLELSVNCCPSSTLCFLRDSLECREGRHRLCAEPAHAGFCLFDRFEFPLLGLHKLELRRRAEQHGWRDILDHTWFCYSPTLSHQPCGTCNPCTYVIQDGLGWRIPWHSRARRVVVVPVRSVTRALRLPMRRLITRPHRLVTKPLELAGVLPLQERADQTPSS